MSNINIKPIFSNYPTINNSRNYNFKLPSSTSLLLPYYTSDKWTKKLKKKISSLSKSYKVFRNRIQKSNKNLKNLDGPDIANQIMQKLLALKKINHSFDQILKNQDIPLNKNENSNKNVNKINNNLTFQSMDLSKLNDYNLSSLTKKNLFSKDDAYNLQKATMKRFYNGKEKGLIDFTNSKSLVNVFKMQFNNEEEFKKLISLCKNSNKIGFFTKNKNNPKLKLENFLPMNKKEVEALSGLRKKQYLDYIKCKSEKNFMQYYYNC